MKRRMPRNVCGQLHSLTYTDGSWQKRDLVIGCIPAENQPQEAPSDLRTMRLPPDWNDSLKINLEYGNTEYLPPLPINIRQLSVVNNKLTELPELPNTLTYIIVNKNDLIRIPRLPPQVIVFEAEKNTLTTIEGPFPKTLSKLKVSHNMLKEMPSLEETTVTSVGIGYNQFTKLPAFPETLKNLGCSNNQITEINNLPNELYILNCSFNPLKKLVLENLVDIATIIASNCELSEIPLFYLPTNIPADATFYFDNNPLTPNFQTIYNKYRTSMNALRHTSATGVIDRRRNATK